MIPELYTYSFFTTLILCNVLRNVLKRLRQVDTHRHFTYVVQGINVQGGANSCQSKYKNCRAYKKRENCGYWSIEPNHPKSRTSCTLVTDAPPRISTMESSNLWPRVLVCASLLFLLCGAESNESEMEVDLETRGVQDFYQQNPNLTNEKRLVS